MILGLLLCHAKYFADQCRKHNISGSVISLGRLDFFVTVPEFFRIMVDAGYADETDNGPIFRDPETQERVAKIFAEERHINAQFRYPKIIAQPVVSDELFYTALGFREVFSLEIADRDGPLTYRFDLNDSDVLSVTGRSFDLVLDAGVMEHVFDVRQVMINIGDLTKVGGHVIHIMPGNNTYDHGFYQFSPTMFRDYYRANKFDIHDISVMRITEDPFMSRSASFSERWSAASIWPYDPVEFCRKSFGGLNEGVYYTCACVRKDEASTVGVNPMQYLFDKPNPPLITPW
ncbi:class I SAM-dependent methyltransferase [Rhizobium sp. RU36D]|uniref:class I SAM-dependent methyltransferase n=1 Tax=Rhizobium sp. RU36D TaxID=1907415 RepID=UPI0009D84767|nr:class I SAM-dependent methyltransferase [Rhizobium sp. RU36D]SMD17405.1 hypothetical protein SAMN05880593_13246 [Rhizobium sp. RU36D]